MRDYNIPLSKGPLKVESVKYLSVSGPLDLSIHAVVYFHLLNERIHSLCIHLVVEKAHGPVVLCLPSSMG